MYKVMFLCFIIILSLYSCSGSTGLSIENFKMENISSPDVLITDSYANLINKCGEPDCIGTQHYKRQDGNVSYMTDSCKLLVYRDNGYQYCCSNDIVSIRMIDFSLNNTSTILYGCFSLDASTTMKDFKRQFDLNDDNFFYYDNPYALCGFDSCGYLLIFQNEQTGSYGSFDFYFGHDKRLKGMYFPVLGEVLNAGY